MNELNIPKVRIVLYAIFFIVTIAAIVFTYIYKDQTATARSSAIEKTTVDVNAVTSFSETDFQNKSTDIDLYVSPENSHTPLYKTDQTGAAAVLEFMQENPTVEEVVPEDSSVKAATTTQVTRKILPPNFDKNSRLIRQIRDKNLPAYIRGTANRDHYYYNQQIGGISVYGSVVRFDVQNNNEIVGVEGSLLTDQSVTRGGLTQRDAEQIVLAFAQSDNPDKYSLTVCPQISVQKSIVNRQLLGFQSQDHNNETYAISVCNNGDTLLFYKTYYVSTQTGEVIYSNQNIRTALNRQIYSCSSGGCQKIRSEGQSPANNSEVDNSYDILGEVYNYYFNNYNRDSFDDRGATIQARVNYPFKNPNAAWTGTYMVASTGMVARDVWAHELTHAVTQYTAGLPGSYQGGSLNESLSDVAGYAIDSANWTMGETTALGTIRDISNPQRISRDGIGPQPDRMFSSGWYCGSADEHGSHHNNGVLNKAFYLMTEGGTFNGCIISGITKEKSLPVIYRAQTTYMKPNDNYKNAYDAILKACADLYTSLDSSECQSVKAALQATEMDQQPAGTQTGPLCSNTTPKTPQCSGVAPQPTSTPGISQSPSPTSILSVTPTPITTSESPTPPPWLVSPTPQETSVPTVGPSPTPSNEPIVKLTLKFQGINSYPVRVSQSGFLVRVILVNESKSFSKEYKVNLGFDDQGIANGSFVADVSPGDGYVALVKGPMHIQKKIGSLTPTESIPGGYQRNNATFSLQIGENDLDFSQIVQLVGDLPTQDGVVNSYDISLVRNNLGLSDQTVDYCDVNYDNVCNAQDYSLLISALSVRVDEE